MAPGQKKGVMSGFINKLRRVNITNNAEDCGPDDNAAPIRHIPKTKETKALLVSALKENYLFSTLSEKDLEDMIMAMQRVMKGPHAEVLTQGQQGSEFYILEKGQCEVFVDEQKVADYNPGGCFGELALIYNARRAATVRTVKPCVLWSLDLRTFRRMLATASSSQTSARIEFLKKVPLLANLNADQINKLAGALSPVNFKENESIIRQGEHGDTFYLIKDGQVKCTQNKNGKEVELLTLESGDYFGEMALLLDEPRHANVIATTKVSCYVMEKHNFIKLLGPVRNVLNRQMRIRVLKSVPLLSKLSDQDLDQIGNTMRVQVFEENQYIVREGEPGTRFYIINEGTVRCTKRISASEEQELMRLSDQEYFGERALLTDEPRAASVQAVTTAECLVLEASDFQKLLGDLDNDMREEVNKRETTDETKPVDRTKKATNYRFQDLTILRTLGTGTFGRVKLVKHNQSGMVGALKCMQKQQIVSSHQERNIMNEKNILFDCAHVFVLELMQTYTDSDQLYMLMELVQGGELWTYIYEKYDLIPRTKFGGFQKGDAQFYAGCVISALKYIHGMGVAYRDLKPENLLMDASGFVKIIDFGFAKKIPFVRNGQQQSKSFTLCGTPEYLSPELVLSRGHCKSVDYWALGCLIYELLCGKTPFQDDNQSEIFKRIIHSQKSISFPRGFDVEANDLISRLLTPNPAFRLGNTHLGVEEIQNHSWFKDFDWDALESKSLPAPHVPPIKDAMDVSNFDHYQDDERVPPYTGPNHYFTSF